MELRLFGKALAVQAAWVFVLFAVLIALPLPEHFFEDAGFVTCPVAWSICPLATARIVSLPATTALGPGCSADWRAWSRSWRSTKAPA